MAIPSPLLNIVWDQAAPGKNFKLSTDPLFVDKVHDIVGLYLNPPERALVLCVDEATLDNFHGTHSIYTVPVPGIYLRHWSVVKRVGGLSFDGRRVRRGQWRVAA